MVRRVVPLVLLAIAALACSCSSTPAEHLDLDQIRITGDPHLRTDRVGGGRFEDVASFVLVDAENTAPRGAYVTLGGELTDASGAVVGRLKPQSLWIPPREVRTFALVDRERRPRPGATSARLTVRGALATAQPPPAHIEELHRFDDHGKIVVQAYVVNASARIASVMVVGAFHDAGGRPMTRPFSMIELPPRGREVVQFVGPPGSRRGTMFIGDATY